MDTIVLDPSSKGSRSFSPASYLDDDRAPLPPGVTAITQPGKNRIGVAGRGGSMSISIAGTAKCGGTECKVIPSFLPSRRAMKDIDAARDIINGYLSSEEGFIGQLPIDARKAKKPEKSISKGVSDLPIKVSSSKFLVGVGSSTVKVDAFIIDPAVVSSVKFQPDRSGITASLTGATCAIGVDKMRAPASTVMFCSDDVSRSSAYKFKSYLDVRKEQFASSRAVQLARGPARMRVSFDRSTRCRVAGDKVCCRNDDDDEVCY